MRYLNTASFDTISTNWPDVISTIRKAVTILDHKDYHQPIKSYVRYQFPQNRIISMPAYIGGDIYIAGIKWIASFPDNIQNDIPRAHSVTILNDASTGIPIGIINSPRISGIRTAGVTGLLLQQYLQARKADELRVGIIGLGPIGQLHLAMVEALAGLRIASYHLYDIRPISPVQYGHLPHQKIIVEKDWATPVQTCDIVITCTVASQPYINVAPKPGSIHMNVSLRDYHADFMDHVAVMVVDDWDEVCRENTNIEHMHKQKGLQRENVHAIQHILTDPPAAFADPTAVIMFNPMGMAIFDIAVGSMYLNIAHEQGVGIDLS